MVYGKLDILIKTKDGLLKTEDKSQQGSLLQTIAHELRSMGPKLEPLLATRYLYLGHKGMMGVGVHLTKHQPDNPQADDMSC